MSNVLALIPARSGSKGIPNKNFRQLLGQSPLERAIRCACGYRVAVSSDAKDWDGFEFDDADLDACSFSWICRPAELAQDDTPMIDVVKHALAEIPGPEDQIILLVQPTQPLREPKHLTAAIQLLEASKADSVVSVVELPLDLSPDMLGVIEHGHLYTFMRSHPWPATRQDATHAYKRDGTVYAFWRKTVDRYNSIYGGWDVRPLIIPPDETCALDSPEDWADAERRLRARDAV